MYIYSIYTYVYINVYIHMYRYIYKYNIFKNYEKCFLFHLKSSIHSQNIQFYSVSRFNGSDETEIIMVT